MFSNNQRKQAFRCVFYTISTFTTSTSFVQCVLHIECFTVLKQAFQWVSIKYSPCKQAVVSVSHLYNVFTMITCFSMYFHITDHIQHHTKYFTKLWTKTSYWCVCLTISIFNSEQVVFSVFYKYNVLHNETELFNVFSRM